MSSYEKNKYFHNVHTDIKKINGSHKGSMCHPLIDKKLNEIMPKKENFKFKYLFKLVEAMANVLTQATLDRFQAYFTDLGTIAERINDNQVDKDKLAAILEEMERTAMGVKQRIERVRAEIK